MLFLLVQTKERYSWLLHFIEFLQHKVYLQHNPANLPEKLPPKQLSVQDVKAAEIQFVKYVETSSFPQIMSILKGAGSRKQQKYALKCSEPFGLRV